jgi:Holliday junction resolvasome RuvABC endonuclease subunit
MPKRSRSGAATSAKKAKRRKPKVPTVPEVSTEELRNWFASATTTIVGIDMSLSSPGIARLDPTRKILSLYFFRSRKKMEHHATLRVEDARSCFHGWTIDIVCILEPSEEFVQKQGVCPKYNLFMHRVAHICALVGPPCENLQLSIEGYAFGKMASPSSSTLMELGGCLRTWMASQGHLLQQLSPSNVKRSFTGKGTSDKDKMYETFQTKFHLPPLCNAIGLINDYVHTPNPVEDLVDAVAVAVSAIQRLIHPHLAIPV